jgi:hypothetical protein
MDNNNEFLQGISYGPCSSDDSSYSTDFTMVSEILVFCGEFIRRTLFNLGLDFAGICAKRIIKIVDTVILSLIAQTKTEQNSTLVISRK